MNGALTIGTLDGANVEIREAVGAENFFLFGLTAERGRAPTKAAGYDPRAIYERQRASCGAVIDLIASGTFSRGDAALFRPLVDALLDRRRVSAAGRLSTRTSSARTKSTRRSATASGGRASRS